VLDLSDLDEEGPVQAEWAALVRERGSELLRFAFQLSHGRARSQDLLQDSIVRVLSSRQNTPSGSSRRPPAEDHRDLLLEQ